MNDLSSLFLGLTVFVIGWIFLINGWNRNSRLSLLSDKAIHGEGSHRGHNRLRIWMNGLLILVGFGIALSAFIADRWVWSSVWLGIGMVLIAILGLAVFDAMRLMIFYRRSVPRIAQETLGTTNNLADRVHSTPAAKSAPESSI